MPPTATETLASPAEIAKLAFRSSGATETETPSSSTGTIKVETPAEEAYKYTHLLPVFDPSEKYPPLELFEHTDPGHRALTHENPRSFLLDRQAKTAEVTPAIGTEIHGVNLLELNNNERDQLALLVAQRGVVVLRDQEQVCNNHSTLGFI